MRWRKVLGVEEIGNTAPTQNTHNTQKEFESHSSAYCAHSANQDKGEEYSKLLEDLSTICKDLDLTPKKIISELTREDIDRWSTGDMDLKELSEIVKSLDQFNAMMSGIVPESYKESAYCKNCGPVWLWHEGIVEGCPWCFVHAKNQPFPRPALVNCESCNYFQRINHPNLGRCHKNQPEPIAGLWDSSERYCEVFKPIQCGTRAPRDSQKHPG